MRNLALAILAIGAAAAVEPVQAQTYDPNYPVCLRVYGGRFGGYYTDCSFTSLPQCNATASGRPALCIINPYFAQGRTNRSGRRRAPVY